MYKLRLSRREKKKLLRLRWLVLFLAICALGFVVWFTWIRPIQDEARIGSFDECVKDGNPVQESYPEVCLTKDGKRFVNPKQQQAHQTSLAGNGELVPPTNPALLNLDIGEWDIRVPLSLNTFDLIYTYIESGSEEYLLFSYKRLVYKELCKGDVGIKMTRSLLQNQPPFTKDKPAATAQVDKYYYYVVSADLPCYDAANAEHVALVKEIAGDQSLTQTTTSLLTKLIAIPKE